ncbi:MAG TPA: trehalase family glycosidase [Anaerolineae bacterium]
MSYVTYQCPLEPLVSKNSFREQVYQYHSILSFLEAREQLPVPVLPGRPHWVEMYWRAWELAWSHLRRPRAGTGLIANYIDCAMNDHIFMWDSAFMVQFGLYGRRAFNFMETLDNFYARQHDDGFICREINPVDGSDFFYPFDPNATGPNILAWSEWRYFRLTGDDSRLPRIFWPLLAFHRWFRANRTWPSGLYWATGLSSAMNNQPRVPDSNCHHRHWSWVDATLQASLNCLVLAQMATLLNEEELARELNAERTRLLHLVNTHMWNSEANFYQDISPDGQFSRIKSIAAYWALLDRDMVSEKQLEPFVRHLRENWAFKLPHRIPSQSADSEGYNAETGHYWRGGVWPATNFMVLKGLRAVGQHDLAHHIAVNHLDNVYTVFRQTDTFWENYAPETAASGNPARSDFVGCTGLTPISILLEDAIGLNVEWPHRRVTWDRRLDTEEEYGVCNYPLGLEGKMDLRGDRAKVVVETNVPFTLIIRDKEQTLQTAIPAGTIEIELS